MLIKKVKINKIDWSDLILNLKLNCPSKWILNKRKKLRILKKKSKGKRLKRKKLKSESNCLTTKKCSDKMMNLAMPLTAGRVGFL